MNRSMSMRTERGLHAKVFDTLGEEIVDGVFPAGAALPLDTLGERFGVSRSVLREALRVLQSLGMIEPRQRMGTLVLPRERWDFMSPQVIEWRGRSAEYLVQMRELLEMRLGLEPVAARLAAHALPSEAVNKISEAAAAMHSACENKDERAFLEADIVFHTEILTGCGNAVIGHFSGTVAASLRTRTHEHRSTITEHTPASVRRHLALATALEERNPDKAYQAAYDMIGATLHEFITLETTKDAHGVRRANI